MKTSDGMSLKKCLIKVCIIWKRISSPLLSKDTKVHIRCNCTVKLCKIMYAGCLNIRNMVSFNLLFDFKSANMRKKQLL